MLLNECSAGNDGGCGREWKRRNDKFPSLTPYNTAHVLRRARKGWLSWAFIESSLKGISSRNSGMIENAAILSSSA